jgi:ubiquitin carboxyl-terminal hydrolase 15
LLYRALKEYLTDNKITKHVVEHESCNTKLINKRDVLTLDDCFNLFTKKEELSDSDLWFCPNCKKHQHATKQMDLWSLPPVLIIHLKRFSYSRIYRDKIDTLVEFPIRGLDLNSYIKHNHKSTDDNYKYNLIAVSNHYGGLGGGHCKFSLIIILILLILF